MSDELRSTPQEVSEWVGRRLDGQEVKIEDAHLAIQQFIPDLLERVEELEREVERLRESNDSLRHQRELMNLAMDAIEEER